MQLLRGIHNPSPEHFASDVRQVLLKRVLKLADTWLCQVFKNAMKFNQEGSDFYQQARDCEKKFEMKFASVAPSSGSAMQMVTTDIRLALQAHTEFAQDGELAPPAGVTALAEKINKMSSNSLHR